MNLSWESASSRRRGKKRRREVSSTRKKFEKKVRKFLFYTNHESRSRKRKRSRTSTITLSPSVCSSIVDECSTRKVEVEERKNILHRENRLTGKPVKPLHVRESSRSIEGKLVDAFAREKSLGVHDKLREDWLKIIRNGLSPEIRDELSAEYRLRENHEFLRAPKLNRELEWCVPTKYVKYDEREVSVQNRLASALVAIDRVLDNMLNPTDDLPDICGSVEILIDAGRILADNHHGASMRRRSNLASAFRIDDVGDLSRVEDRLFGERFSKILRNTPLCAKISKSEIETSDGEEEIGKKRANRGSGQREDKAGGKKLEEKTRARREDDKKEEKPEEERVDKRSQEENKVIGKIVAASETDKSEKEKEETKEETRVRRNEKRRKESEEYEGDPAGKYKPRQEEMAVAAKKKEEMNVAVKNKEEINAAVKNKEEMNAAAKNKEEMNVPANNKGEMTSAAKNKEEMTSAAKNKEEKGKEETEVICLSDVITVLKPEFQKLEKGLLMALREGITGEFRGQAKVEIQKAPAPIGEFPGIEEATKRAYKARGTCDGALDNIINAHAVSTRRGYERPIRFWWEFCRRHNIDVYNGTARDALRFFVENSIYISTVNVLRTWRAALGEFTVDDLSRDLAISNYLKGFENEKKFKITKIEKK